MTKFLTLIGFTLLIFSCQGISSCKKKKSVDLFIWAGQSNAQGWMGDAKYYPIDSESLDKDILLNYTFFGKTSSNNQWIPMSPQKGRFSSGHFGPEVSFSRELKKAGYNPAIFKYTRGGTSIYNDWKLPKEKGIYDSMIKELLEAVLELQNRGYTVNFEGFIWIQGESDAENDQMAQAFKNNLTKIITDIRKVTKNKKLKVILGVDEQHSWVVKRPVIVESQKKIAAEDYNINYTSMIGLPKADATHLTSKGLVEHGHIIYEALKKMN